MEKLLIVKIRSKNLYFMGDIADSEIVEIEKIANQIIPVDIDAFSQVLIKSVYEQIKISLNPCTSIDIIRIKK